MENIVFLSRSSVTGLFTDLIRLISLDTLQKVSVKIVIQVVIRDVCGN